MKTNFKFDKKTGTMIADDTLGKDPIVSNADNDIQKRERNKLAEAPKLSDEKKMEVKSDSVSVMQGNVLQMKRVDKITPIQLVNDNGIPESYLDSVTTGVMMFRERQDYDIYQIVDERTSKPLAYIGGYALQISFDMSELNSMEKIEQCLGGMTKMFRKFIMEQAINR